MPHKHTRRGEIDKSTIDLPPSIIAKPLPVSKSANQNGVFTSSLDNTKRASKKRKRNKDNEDDTPKAFQRLMAMTQGKKLPKGLDDGVRLSKKQKKAAAAERDEGHKLEGKVEELVKEIPTIRPGEKMSDFAARVDAALPVGGLINKSARGGKDPLGLQVGRTKTEKRMHRMYAEWRVEEARRQEKRQEALELAEQEELDEDGQVKWKIDVDSSQVATGKKGKKGKGKKKKKVIGEVDDGDEDPWAKIQRDRGEAKAGLNDVVQAPPTFSRIPKEKFKVRGATVDVGDVPKASGSLRRREELKEVRKSIVEGYRTMMKANKQKVLDE